MPSPDESKSTLSEHLEKGSFTMGMLGLAATFVLPILYMRLVGNPPLPFFGVLYGSIGLVGAGTARFKSPIVYLTLILSVFLICGGRVLLQFGATDQERANNLFLVGALLLAVPMAAFMMWLCSCLQPWYVRYLLPIAMILMSFAIAVTQSRS